MIERDYNRGREGGREGEGGEKKEYWNDYELDSKMPANKQKESTEHKNDTKGETIRVSSE